MKKTILMIHNFYQIGGGEHTVFNNEVELLRNNGHKVITYTRDNKEINNSFIKKILLPFTTVWSFKTYREVKRIIEKEKIDIVHCHNTFPLISPSAYYAARKMNIPVIQTIHNFRFLCPNAIFYRNGKICEDCLKNDNFKCALKNKCYRKSKIQTFIVTLMLKIHRKLGTYNKINYIFLTEFNKNKFSKLINVNGDNIFIKPNFVEKKYNFKRPNKLNNTFIFMGRLDENKGIKFLIDSWKNIKDYELHIYGDGEYKELVKKAAKDNSNIKYFGFKPQEEIFKDLVKSQALIIPSTCYEGFPMTIAESCSLGVPTLSVNIGNHSAIIKKSQAGRIYELNNHKSLFDNIKEIVSNNKNYSNNAQKYYENELSPKKNYKELTDIYEKAKVIK